MDRRQYVSPTPGEFPLIATSPWNEKASATPCEDDFRRVKDCGFNAGMLTAGASQMAAIRSAAAAADLKLIVGNPAISSTKAQMKEFVQEATGSTYTPTENEKSLNGAGDSGIITAWRYINHPKVIDFGKLMVPYGELNEWDTARSIFIDLIGEPNSDIISPCQDYQAYLDAVDLQFCPMLWGYNHYPFHVSSDGVANVSYERFYENLMIFSRRYRDDGIPFWNYVQCAHVKRASNNSTRNPVATEAKLRFQIFNSLAFCVKGLVFWTVGLRPSNSSDIFVSALFDDDDQLTDAGHAAKKIIREVRCLSDIFVDAKPENYYTTGQIYNDPNNAGNQTPTLKANGDTPYYVETDGRGAFVTTFHSKDRRFPFKMRYYLMVVSQDPENSQTAVVNFKSQLANGMRLKAYSILPDVENENGGFIKSEIETGSLMVLQLPESGYLLFEYETI